MRIDKFLKVSRVIKRRTVANEAADNGRIIVNGKVVKPSYEVKIGDIFVFKDGADILVLDEISKFLLNNISSLTRFSKSKIEKISIENIRKKEINKEEIKIISSSMRLDCVVSELLKTSRGKAEEIIKEQRVFVNFENVDKLTKQIKENDLITIRGKGRFEIAKIEGITRNERIKLIVNRFV